MDPLRAARGPRAGSTHVCAGSKGWIHSKLRGVSQLDPLRAAHFPRAGSTHVCAGPRAGSIQSCVGSQGWIHSALFTVGEGGSPHPGSSPLQLIFFNLNNVFIQQRPHRPKINLSDIDLQLIYL